MAPWGEDVEMLLVYSRNKVVDSVLPCGIPCVIVWKVDCVVVVWSDWVRLVK